MKKQLICATLLAASLIPASALASEIERVPVLSESIIQPRYGELLEATPQLTVSGGTARYLLDATGKSTVTKISATLQIQKQNSNGTFSDYGSSWSVTSNSRMLNTSGSKRVDSGGTYRLKASITLYIGSSSYTEVVYS